MLRQSFINHALGLILVLVCTTCVATTAGPYYQHTTAGSIGRLNHAYAEHTATLLSDGKVIVAGGIAPGPSAYAAFTSEVYDPATRTWSPSGFLNTERSLHTATLLLNGNVLIAGGHSDSFGEIPSKDADLYDPVTRKWSITDGPMETVYGHTATLMANGKVLVAGGAGSFGNLSRSELYDPVTGTWRDTGSLGTARYGHTATLLPDGKVLVAGGISDKSVTSAELYDPATETWSATGNLVVARANHTAALLQNGKVLVVGGTQDKDLSSAELYDTNTLDRQEGG